MRILRGQSNLEVSSKGFAIFAIGLILATFCGGAIRTMLRLDRVQEFIVGSVQKQFPSAKVEIQKTKVLLSRSGFPAIAVQLEDVDWRITDCRQAPIVFSAKEIVLPVDLWASLGWQLKLSTVEIRSGHLTLGIRDESKCETVAKTAETTNSNTKPDVNLNPSVVTSHRLPKRPDWSSVAQHVDGLEIQSLVITHEGRGAYKGLVRSLRLDLRSGMKLSGDFEFEHVGGTGFQHRLSLSADSTEDDIERLNWRIQSAFKEGSIELNGEYRWDSGEAQVNSSFRQIPMRELSVELQDAGLIKQQIDLKSTWLSCSWGWNLNAAQPVLTPIHIHSCQLEGAYGEANWQDVQFLPGLPLVPIAPFEISIRRAQIHALLEALNVKVLPVVVAKWGEWNGTVKVTSDSIWVLDGQLDNLEVNFSSQSVRGKQLIRGLQHHVERDSKGLAASISAMEIVGGEFDGDVAVQLNLENRGPLRLDIRKLKLSPEIESLLIGGVLEGFAIKGQGIFHKGIETWDGESVARRLVGKGWELEGIRLRHFFQNEHLNTDVKISALSIDDKWPFIGPLVKSNINDRKWRDFTAHLEVSNRGGTISKGRAVAQPNGIQWRTEGGWLRDGDFSAQLTRKAKGQEGRALRVRFGNGRLSIN